jgi:hypothetical protein
MDNALETALDKKRPVKLPLYQIPEGFGSF